MDQELFDVICPYCGEGLEIYIEADVHGDFVQDCEVCCNPWVVHVSRSGRERAVDLTPGDGRE